MLPETQTKMQAILAENLAKIEAKRQANKAQFKAAVNPDKINPVKIIQDTQEVLDTFKLPEIQEILKQVPDVLPPIPDEIIYDPAEVVVPDTKVKTVKPYNGFPTLSPRQIEKVASIFITEYSEKAIVVRGETKPHKDTLRDLGGCFNFKLKGGAGWIFSKKKEETVRAALGI